MRLTLRSNEKFKIFIWVLVYIPIFLCVEFLFTGLINSSTSYSNNNVLYEGTRSKMITSIYGESVSTTRDKGKNYGYILVDGGQTFKNIGSYTKINTFVTDVVFYSPYNTSNIDISTKSIFSFLNAGETYEVLGIEDPEIKDKPMKLSLPTEHFYAICNALSYISSKDVVNSLIKEGKIVSYDDKNSSVPFGMNYRNLVEDKYIIETDIVPIVVSFDLYRANTISSDNMSLPINENPIATVLPSLEDYNSNNQKVVILNK